MNREIKFLGGIIHRLLLRELHHNDPTDEIQFMLGNNSVRFSKVPLEEIRDVVTVVEFGEAYDAVKLCLIYMLNWILMGVDKRFKIPVWQFWLVEDLDAFNAFPWGAHVYRFEQRQQEKGADVHRVETYNIYGLSQALLIFAYEVIPDLGKEFGAQRVTDLAPRILKWGLTKQPRGKKLAKIFKARVCI
ncbi:hypothetical protein Ddye_005120 [Dipteronia dyeriana]|uniref:DUF1985 domain-containing protein n=1 Tax=Dipteronia dyeriana TaxID=168575 RepID=A0AAE0CPE6_9ROSI|nr:hypothetical protein Ddye_005120 [Dipteronia dyeriana]